VEGEKLIHHNKVMTYLKQKLIVLNSCDTFLKLKKEQLTIKKV